MGFWDLFQKKKAKNIKDENLTDDETSEELTFAKKFTDAGGRFIYIDDGDSVINTFNKISEENNWEKENVKCFSSSLSNNLSIKKTNDITEDDKLKALVIECECLLSNSGRMLISSNQIKNNKLESLPFQGIYFSHTSLQPANNGKLTQPSLAELGLMLSNIGIARSLLSENKLIKLDYIR